MAKMYKKYERMLNSGEYENENELCNALGLNYDDLYEDECQDDEDSSFTSSKRGRYSKPLFGDSKGGRK